MCTSEWMKQKGEGRLAAAQTVRVGEGSTFKAAHDFSNLLFFPSFTTQIFLEFVCSFLHHLSMLSTTCTTFFFGHLFWCKAISKWNKSPRWQAKTQTSMFELNLYHKFSFFLIKKKTQEVDGFDSLLKKRCRIASGGQTNLISALYLYLIL